MAKLMPNETDSVQRPTLHLDGKDIKNIEKFSIGDKITVKATGEVTSLSTYGEGKDKSDNVKIKLFDIETEPKGDSETENILKARVKQT